MATNPTVAAWTKGNRQRMAKPPVRPAAKPTTPVRAVRPLVPPTAKAKQASILDQLAAEIGKRWNQMTGGGTNQHTTGLGTSGVRVYPGTSR